MVSGVLQNACLRMDEEGAGLDDLLSPSGIHRWLGRGGIAIGGAASLLVGAVFGGILESVPVLLPPPAAAVSSPHIDSGGSGAGLPANTPWTLAADAVPAVQVTPQPAPAIGAPAGSNFSTVATPTLPSAGKTSTGSGSGTQAGSTSTPGGVLGGTGTGSTPTVPTSPTPAPAPSPVQQVVTAVQNTTSTATGTVQNTVGTVTGTTQTLLAPISSSGTSSGTSSGSTTGVVSGTTSTVTNTVSTTTSTLGL